jgi:hypothetical protein
VTSRSASRLTPRSSAVDLARAIRRHARYPVEAYKKSVDRTLLRENLKLSVEERVRKMMAALRLVEEIRRSSRATR